MTTCVRCDRTWKLWLCKTVEKIEVCESLNLQKFRYPLKFYWDVGKKALTVTEQNHRELETRLDSWWWVCFVYVSPHPNYVRWTAGQWFRRARLCYLVCVMLFSSILHVPSYLTWSVSEECHACWLLFMCSDCTNFIIYPRYLCLYWHCIL